MAASTPRFASERKTGTMTHRRPGAALLLGSVMLAGACSTGGTQTRPSPATASALPSTLPPSTTVGSTQTSDAALRAAAKAMASARSFRFVADISRSGAPTLHLSGEFSAPDHVHETITGTPQGSTEVAFIGKTTYRRRPDGHWVQGAAKPGGASAGSSSGDPRQAFEVLEDAKSVTTGSSSTFTLTGTAAHRLDGAATTIRGNATLAGSTITALDYQGDDPSATKVVLQYSDIGTAPEVIAPRVG
ncbi:MAG: hypothetical protein NVSMB16_03830 [Acidimicrobiales bacterium]